MSVSRLVLIALTECILKSVATKILEFIVKALNRELIMTFKCTEKLL